MFRELSANSFRLCVGGERALFELSALTGCCKSFQCSVEPVRRIQATDITGLMGCVSERNDKEQEVQWHDILDSIISNFITQQSLMQNIVKHVVTLLPTAPEICKTVIAIE